MRLLLTRLPLLAALAAALALAAPPDAGLADGGAPDAGWDVNAPGLPGHDVPLDVTQGTWMSVDVSPRGDQVVFDLLGDLYVVPMKGGEARALTTGAAWDMQPRYSPDGTQLAFTSDRGGGDNLWLLPLDGGTATPVTKETFRLLNSPAWSPDGRFLVARKHFTSRRSLGAGELWMVHRSGGEGVQLTEKPNDQKDLGEPAFAPDGRSVYFSQDVTPGATFEYNKDPNTQLYAIVRLDLETKEQVRFVTGPGGSVRPTPSPDGKHLAFVRRVRGKSTLMLADVASGAERTLTDMLDRDLQEAWAIHGVSPAMAWTRDNRALVFSAKGKLWRIDVADKRVTNIPFHVKATRRVFDTVRFAQQAAPAEAPVRMLRWPQVAPSGRQVVYEALGLLWTRVLPTGAPRRLTRQTTEREAYPSFSRDGRSIVYVSWDDDALGRLKVVSASGGEGREVLRTPGHYVSPVFSPDGRSIVFRAVDGGGLVSAVWGRRPGLYVVPTTGGVPRRLSPIGSSAHFGPERDRVYFLTVDSSGKDDVRALKSIALDGSEERTHLTSDEATEYRVSPDGNWVAWRENFNAFVMPFPLGAKAPVASPDSKALPVAKVSKDAGEWLHWSADSKRLHWTLGPQLYTRELKDAFAFLVGAPEKLPEPPAAGRDIGFIAKSDVARGTLALVGGRIVTLEGDTVIDDGTLVAKDGRIVAVGPRASTSVPRGAKVVDVKGKTLVPGLVDVHWHGALAAAGIVPEQNWVLLAGLAFGVTTVHDPSNDTDGFFAAAELARTGAIVSPRLFSTGTILYGAQGFFRAPIETLDDARSHLRRLKAVGAFSVKSYNQPRRDQRQKVLTAARELQMLVVPEGGSLFQHNMTMVVDGHTTVEHALPVAPVYEDVLQLWSQTATGYTPTLGVAYGGLSGENYWYAESDVWKDPRLSRFLPRRVLDARSRRRVKTPPEEWNHIAAARVAHALAEQGVRVNLGAHGQREGLAAHWELWSLVQGGMTPLQALRAGTLSGAQSLGLDQDLGSLQVGKLADVLVLDANPLTDIRNSRQVHLTVLGGRLYDAATLDELWPVPKKRAPLYFQREGGQAWPPGAAETDAAGVTSPCGR